MEERVLDTVIGLVMIMTYFRTARCGISSPDL